MCDSPAPQYGGDDCTVDGSTDTETEMCNENPCPSKFEVFDESLSNGFKLLSQFETNPNKQCHLFNCS